VRSRRVFVHGDDLAVDVLAADPQAGLEDGRRLERERLLRAQALVGDELDEHRVAPAEPAQQPLDRQRRDRRDRRRRCLLGLADRADRVGRDPLLGDGEREDAAQDRERALDRRLAGAGLDHLQPEAVDDLRT
jgi:hypothetical protein